MNKADSCKLARAARWGTSGVRHGCAKRGEWTPEYSAWMNMRGRVAGYDPKNESKYGARGIAICERWNSFENFLADMGPRPPGMSLDRRDNDRGYEPGNCQWATASQQNHNTRRKRSNTSGHAGVSFDKRSGKWRARILLHRKEHGLGLYTNIEDAGRAYREAKAKILSTGAL